MTMRVFAAVSAGLMLAASLGAAAPAPAAPVVPLASTMAAAVMFQQYYPGPGIYCFTGSTGCYPVGYHHDVYSDAELTNLIGSGDDTCSSYGEYVYVNTPSLPSGYEVKTPIWVCTPDGITLVDF